MARPCSLGELLIHHDSTEAIARVQGVDGLLGLAWVKVGVGGWGLGEGEGEGQG